MRLLIFISSCFPMLNVFSSCLMVKNSINNNTLECREDQGNFDKNQLVRRFHFTCLEKKINIFNFHHRFIDSFRLERILFAEESTFTLMMTELKNTQILKLEILIAELKTSIHNISDERANGYNYFPTPSQNSLS